VHLDALDWTVVAGCVALAFVPALFFARRAGRGTSEFFGSGRAAPWWLVGTSMVATTFSTDTPNLVTDLVRSGAGVSQNWVWWAFLLTGMLTVFFYARLWRRSGALTDLEFYELRYAGRPAAFVRGFRAVYLGLFFNGAIMAAVTLAAVKIASLLLGVDREVTLLACVVFCVLFSAISGLWGVMAADLIQFTIAMAGVFVAAFHCLSLPEVGGWSGLLEKIPAGKLDLLPDLSDGSVTLTLLVIPLTVQWWSVWYPGAEPGGGSYVAQRMLAAKDERHALGATLWFNVAHYALRPWPWIVVALCSLVVFPTLADIQRAFPHVDPALIGHDIAYPAMLSFLPHGLLGLLVAALFSAYLSTMSTHLNWGASYLVNDLYQRFLAPGRTDRHYVQVSRLCSVGLMLFAAGLVYLLNTAREAFDVLLQIGAGTGLLYLLRWYWWRINAWSEIAAMASSFAIALGLLLARRAGADIPSHVALLGSVAATTFVWVAVTFLTRPTRRETLLDFVRKVQPAGPGWRDLRREAGVRASPDSPAQAFLGWVLGCAFVYGALLGTGNLLYGNLPWAGVSLGVALASGLLLWRLLAGILSRRPAG
jgi:Na+/proline symporter